VSKKLFDIEEFRSQPLPCEEEIMANWQGDIENPVVSILCNTFNQKMYIEDAFRGFLIQKTDFVFEVVVHDDASTDGTSDIVREYAKRYPKIFKPVIQTENQYSQGKKITLLSAEYARSEYIALCEGDDFWIDESKLQKQILSLEKNKDIDICFTSGLRLMSGGGLKQYKKYLQEQVVYSLSQVIGIGGDGMATPSIVMRKKTLEAFGDWINRSSFFDFYMQIEGSKKGGAIFIPSNSIVYRVNATGSWSSKRKLLDEMKISKELEGNLYCMKKTLSGPLYKNELLQVDASLYHVASYELILNGFYSKAKRLSVLSWESKAKINRVQIFIYKTRAILPITRLVLLVNRLLKNKIT
jgi:glycosyltransferase involved in cell wall biosynthesis